MFQSWIELSSLTSYTEEHKIQNMLALWSRAGGMKYVFFH